MRREPCCSTLALLLALLLGAGCAAQDSPAADAGGDAEPTADATAGDQARPDSAAGDLAADGPPRPRPCNGQPGTLSNQQLVVAGETRYYFLHVPASYSCDGEPWPLLVDFHGTGGMAGSSGPEEAYGHPELVELATRERFIVARLRSRSAKSGQWETYQWNINAGDVQRNVAFTHALLAELDGRYYLDPQRRYATGFSNGTAMALELFGDAQAAITGFAVVGGGLWQPRAGLSWGATAPRIYAVTGYRDYMHTYLRRLTGSLSAAAFPQERLFVRAVDAGHELYGWHWNEIWAWLDRGQRPPAGTLAAGWSRDASFTGTDDLLAVARSADGALVATGSGGAVYRKPAGGSWSLAARLKAPGQPGEPLTDVCLVSSGRGIALGHEGTVAETDDGGASWALRSPVDDFFGQQGSSFGYSYLIGLGCADPGLFVAGGYWAGATSADGGQTWQARAMTGSYGVAAQVAAAAVADTGTTVAVGYWSFVGRGEAGQPLTGLPLPAQLDWYNDVAAAPGGTFFVVGEKGALLRSTDDGKSWTLQLAPVEQDLYAVAFRDAKLGLAVGAHGTALLTTDGATWQDVSTGTDLFLGDVLWLDDQQALVVGEGGAVLTYQRP